jgi:hypothetical protein
MVEDSSHMSEDHVNPIVIWTFISACGLVFSISLTHECKRVLNVQ